MVKKKGKYIIIVAVLFFFPFISNGATLELESEADEIASNDNFAVNIKIDELTQCVNTIEAEIDFDYDKIQYVDFLTGESIISLWVENPTDIGPKDINNKGIIGFSGGIPGGYCGKVPGDPGESNYIAKIIFKAKSDIYNTGLHKTDIEFSKANVYVHDGLGTLDKVETKNESLEIVSSSTSSVDWNELIKTDKIPPEPFVISLFKNPDIFNGRYYIVFHAVDKQTGIDHFEVLEITQEELYGDIQNKNWIERILSGKKRPAQWKKTSERPYLLSDQDLGSVIKVKAVDKAGNERMVEYIPDKKLVIEKDKTLYNLTYILILVLSAIVIAFLLSWIIRIRIKLNNK